MVKVCPKCGRTDKEVPFIGFFCRDCYLEEHPPVHVPERLELPYCVMCERIYTGRWTEFSLEAVRDWLKRKIRVNMDDAFVSFSFPEVDEGHIEFNYLSHGSIGGVPVQVSGSGEIRLKKTLCPRCARESGGYFEAIIQVRGANVYQHAEEIARMVEQGKGEYNFVAKVVERREGVDLYVGSRKIADKVAKRIERRYGIKAVRSHTLVTEKNGKRLYRLTVALHFKE